ncbi:MULTISPECIES: ArsR family transcriptional regulator [Methanohalophilus]|jgi:predicted transcriptional regulator|uniref:Regulatory protein, arsR family n=1 Tax=Methanohalophilus euhalobius TaxID=51203 RepID=A0A285F922_9EURY|nr:MULTISPECIES: ArsR family transcriptional regulator [Methanohalophilus]ODV50123.1 MAG: hypothetical protein A8273_782 [Methanohalophilus sp. 2-GBenrich]RSD33677.1 MAG: hypothetical protein CI953_1402 [Methanohalophilus sp.]RXG33362.1 hypothetical protein CI957_1980 [Methanohalophilus sp. WG1-DM]SNY07815.1 regulatory protein, arsR family [Methanohalophilus euhalobius]
MRNLWTLFLLFILICSPALASTNGYEVSPYTGPERGMYEGGGDDATLTFWELPLSLQIVYISGLLGALLAVYKFLPLLLGKVRQNCKKQNRDEIFKFITANPGNTISDIEKHLKLNRSTIRYHLKMLQIFNKIKYVRKGKFVMVFENISRCT